MTYCSEDQPNIKSKLALKAESSIQLGVLSSFVVALVGISTFLPPLDYYHILGSKKIHIQFSEPKCANTFQSYAADTHFCNSSINIYFFFFLIF